MTDQALMPRQVNHFIFAVESSALQHDGFSHVRVQGLRFGICESNHRSLWTRIPATFTASRWNGEWIHYDSASQTLSIEPEDEWTLPSGRDWNLPSVDVSLMSLPRCARHQTSYQSLHLISPSTSYRYEPGKSRTRIRVSRRSELLPTVLFSALATRH